MLALIGVSLFAAAIEPWEGHFVHVKGPSRGDWQDALPIAPVSNVHTYISFRVQKSYHKGYYLQRY